jgi:hypothetical protein
MAITTVTDLKQFIHDARWFSALGTFPATSGFVPVRRLQKWTEMNSLGDVVNPSPMDEIDILFPTTQDEEDPVHRDTLKTASKRLGKTELFKQTRQEVFKITLVSLRVVGEKHPGLTIGGMNAVLAAKGAALYAARQAAGEIVVEMQGFWCSLIPLYVEGHWPLGIASNGDIVIF